jgi:16S rRNA processing protein RimM
MALSAELMEVGVLTGTHGLRGDLKVHPLPTGELVLPGVRDVLLRDAAGQLTPYRVQRSSPHKQFFLIHFTNIETVDTARTLVGQTLLVRRDALPDLPEDQLLWCDLDGLIVIDRRRGRLGRVEEMFSTAAHDILVVRSADGEVLIPAIPPFVCDLDRDAGELLVDLPDGLVPYRDEI